MVTSNRISLNELPSRRVFPRVAALVAIVMLAATGGCGGPKQDDMQHFLRSHETLVSGVDYRVAPPDIVQISSPQALEVDGDIQLIRMDGKINLRLLGEVKIAGLTTPEIASKLETLLSRYYQRPQVNVRVVGYRSKHIFVTGEVTGGGALPYTGRDTLLEVLSQAQPTFSAWTGNVKVIRPSPDKSERHEVTVNVDKIMKEGDLKKNILLQEGDIVYVPPTPMAWVGNQFRQLLLPVAPATQTIITPKTFESSVDVYRNSASNGLSSVSPTSVGGF